MNSRLIVAATLALAGTADAAPVNQVAYATLTGLQVVNFDDLPAGGPSGTNRDAIFVSNGVAFGERFAGQTLGVNGLFDTLSGMPAAGLAVVAGAPGRNLALLTTAGSNALVGLGPLGFPEFDSIGEGAFALRFSTGQSQFGFQLVGGAGGTASVAFFGATGNMIDLIDIGSLSADSYGFSREGDLQDIFGISVFNNDLGGIGVDNLRFDVASDVDPDPGPDPVPAPGAIALLGLGLATLVRRRG